LGRFEIIDFLMDFVAGSSSGWWFHFNPSQKYESQLG